MSITFTEKTINPENQTEKVKTQSVSLKTTVVFDGMFFVVGRSNTGARYYSDTIEDWNTANKIFSGYCDIISYFGGGNIDLFCLHNDGYDIVYSKNI